MLVRNCMVGMFHIDWARQNAGAITVAERGCFF